MLAVVLLEHGLWARPTRSVSRPVRLSQGRKGWFSRRDFLAGLSMNPWLESADRRIQTVRVALLDRCYDANASARVRFAYVWAMGWPALAGWFRLRRWTVQLTSCRELAGGGLYALLPLC